MIAAPAATGQTGLVNMPDARLAADGTLDLGIAHSGEVNNTYATMTVLPRLEATLALLRIESLQTDPSVKAVDLKLVLVEEHGAWPQLAIGATDVFGERPFLSQYVVASKRFGELDLSLGFGAERIDGAFGGLRWRPGWAKGWAATLEHDANDYAGDLLNGQPLNPKRDGGLTAALEYDGGWWGAAATAEDGGVGGRAWLRLPLGAASWTAKAQEPPPLARTAAAAAPQPSAGWGADRAAALRLAEALYAQDFDSVDVALDDDTLLLRLSNNRISLVGRAVGRAARTALLHGPTDLKALRITYEQARLPIATYSFSDLAVLRDYFAGRGGPETLAPTIKVTYASTADAARLEQHALLLAEDLAPELGEPRYRLDIGENARGNWFAFERYKRDTSSFQLKPLNLDCYFDGGADLRYDLYAVGRYTRELTADLQLAAAARLTLATDLDGTTTPNDSLLPHVRSDVALYRDGGALKLDRLYLAQQMQLGERWYGRFSVGLYEEMFAGAGGQVLYLPANGDWATDLTIDYARQRDYDGWGLLDYDTVTVLAALHWRVPARGLTFTARGGRFLAGDSGLRVEAQRRLRSGVRFGFWYTATDGDDVTGPGSPSHPYHDKGIFLSIPLAIALPYDSRARASISLAPWNRDVGQMLRGPGDLYSVFEDVLLLNTTDQNPLSQFGR